MWCSKCNRLLRPVFPNRIRRKGDFPQYENVLVIDFRGGYSMYYDGPPKQVLLCASCASVLLVQNNSWLNLEE